MPIIIYIKNVLYSKHLTPGKSLLISVSQNTHAKKDPLFYCEVFDLARELGLDICINGHGVTPQFTKAYSEIGLEFIKIDSF